MGLPKPMLSKIIETDSEIIISTPKRKSWVLIIFLSMIFLVFSNDLIQALFFIRNGMTIYERIGTILISLLAIYFSARGLLWQLRGSKEIRISKTELKYSKLSPLMSKTKTYNVADIKAIAIKDESVLEGPIAMLQLLRITDKIKITFIYGYETISTISGFDMSEAIELKNKIENKIKG